MRNPLFALWLMLTLALAIFVGVSFMKEMSVGSYTLTKAGFRDALMKIPEPDDSQNQDSILLEAVEFLMVSPDYITRLARDTVAPDTTVHNVLVFGDSMTHHLAMSIAKYGTKNNYKVTGVTWESSSIPAWSSSGKINEYIRESHPDFIIVSLGSNEMELKYFDKRIPDVKNILEQIDTIPYVWVGPPLWKEDKGVYTMLEKTLPKGVLFKLDGTKTKIPRGPDNVHPTRKGADLWADTIMRWISRSAHPILAEHPDSGTSTKGHKFVYLHADD